MIHSSEGAATTLAKSSWISHEKGERKPVMDHVSLVADTPYSWERAGGATFGGVADEIFSNCLW
jgi:hypothetical protein